MAETTGQFNLAQSVKIVLRRKWLFILPLVICPVVFFCASFLLPKIYRAQSVILLQEKKAVNPLLQGMAVSTTLAQRLSSIREDILSWPRLLQLVERLELDQNVNTPSQMEGLIKGIRNRIEINLKGKEVVIIGYEGDDPHQTQKLVNTLGDILIRRNLSFQREDTSAAIDFIEEQLEVYKKKLANAESRWLEFMEIYGSGFTGFRPDDTAFEQVKAQEAYSEGVTLRQINERLASLETELVMESVNLTDDHPRILEINNSIEVLKEKRNQYISKMAKKIGANADEYLEMADSIPRQQEAHSRLRREKESVERIYSMLLERLETARITESLDESDNRTKFRIIEPARLPLDPIKPNKPKMTLMGLLIGAALGVGLIYLLELMDTSFRNEDQLEATFEYPVLGSITRILTEEDLHAQYRKRVLTILLSLAGILIFIVGSIFIARKLGYNFEPAIQAMAEFAWNTKETIVKFMAKIKQVFV